MINQKQNNENETDVILNVKDFRKELKIGRDSAYRLMSKRGFPLFFVRDSRKRVSNNEDK